MVLVRLPNPISIAMVVASMMYNVMLFWAKYFLTLLGRFFFTSSAFQTVFNKKVPFFFKPLVTSYRLR
ncbi:MAG: hypothetical protein BWY72_01419 [Bacteroidetes bacterium ADurb.Bin416]|nr:MAG: hypothetical protein BWY72_01419 [Bacteroidetes bacterium ADurb.Bin416]